MGTGVDALPQGEWMVDACVVPSGAVWWALSSVLVSTKLLGISTVLSFALSIPSFTNLKV